MKPTLENAPFYLVIVAVLKEDIKIMGTTFKKGEEFVVDQETMRTKGYTPEDAVFLKRRNAISSMGVDVFYMQFSTLEFKVKTIFPEFKIGDLIMRKSKIKVNDIVIEQNTSRFIPQKIGSYNLGNDGTIWYSTEFGDKTGTMSGFYESDIRLATAEEAQKAGYNMKISYEQKGK